MGFKNDQLDQLKRIHHQVTYRFEYKNDIELWGKIEHWDDDFTIMNAVTNGLRWKGDCEETAKAFLLLALPLGLNGRLVVGYDETGQGHCWTEIASEDLEEAIYLDNRRSTAVARNRLYGYLPVAASPWNPVPGDTRPWIALRQEKIA